MRMRSPGMNRLGGAERITGGRGERPGHRPERGPEREGERSAERERRRCPAGRNERAEHAAGEAARDTARRRLGEEQAPDGAGARAEREAEPDLLAAGEEEHAERSRDGERRRRAEGDGDEEEEPLHLREERLLRPRHLRDGSGLGARDGALDCASGRFRRPPREVGAHERERDLAPRAGELLEEPERQEEILILGAARLDRGGEPDAGRPPGRLHRDLLAGREREPGGERRAGHRLVSLRPTRRHAPERVQPAERDPAVADRSRRDAVQPHAGEERRGDRLHPRPRRDEAEDVRLPKAPLLLDRPKLERAEAEPERSGTGQDEQVRPVGGELLPELALDAARHRDEAEDERRGERERCGADRARGEAPLQRAAEPAAEEPGSGGTRGHQAPSFSSGAGSSASARRSGQIAPAAATRRAPPRASGTRAAPGASGAPNTAVPRARTRMAARNAPATPPTAPSASTSVPSRSTT